MARRWLLLSVKLQMELPTDNAPLSSFITSFYELLDSQNINPLNPHSWQSFTQLTSIISSVFMV